MAQRMFNAGKGSLLKGLVRLYPVVSVGAAGAVTLKKRQFTAAGAGSVAPVYSLVAAPTTGVGYVRGDGAGVYTVARTGTGAWTVTLSDPYQYLVGVTVCQTSNANGIPAAPDCGVVSGSTTVTTNTAVGNGGVIAIQLSLNGAAADPASGDVLTLEIILGDASEP